MKKRIKLISIICSFCFSLSLLVVGVFAVQTVSFGVTSSLSFSAEGVFVMIDGNIKQGTSTSQNSISSYKGYSYKPVSDTNNLPSGQQTNNFVSSDGITEATWSAGTDITFTTTNNVVKYVFTFTNYTEKIVYVTKTINIEELKSNFGEENVVESHTGVITLPAFTGDNPSSVEYSLTIELNNFTSSFEGRVMVADFIFSDQEIILAPIERSNTYPQFGLYINDTLITSAKLDETYVKVGDVFSRAEGLYVDFTRLDFYVYGNDGQQVLIGSLENGDTETEVIVPELKQGDYIYMDLIAYVPPSPVG